jgi:hypothetical protein
MADKDKEPIVQEETDGSAVITLPEGELPEAEPIETQPAEATPPGEPDPDDPDGLDDPDETLKRGDLEQRRHDRKEERQRKKVARDRAIERARLQEEHARRLQAEVEDLKKKLSDMDRRTTSTEIAGAQQQLNDAALEEQYWKQQRVNARKENNPDAEADAEEKLYAARRKRESLSNVIENAKRVQARPAQQQAPLPDAEVQRMARDWHAKNSWYKPAGSDESSRVVKALDEAIASEGYNPREAAYYAELDRRIAKYLPDQRTAATSGPSDQRPNRMPVTGTGRDAAPAPKANEFRLSAERVKAMKDAGIWDDPARRAKTIKQYASFDRQNRNNNG